MNKLMLMLAAAIVLTAASHADTRAQTVTVSHSSLEGIGAEAGVMRRDPSDVIKVGDLYYVWYSKGKIAPGYDATVWYASSSDGHKWTEKGMALGKGEAGTWDGASVFTPNILVAEGRYWLFYTGTSKEFSKRGFSPDSKIGIAVSDSPDGPWERLATNPALTNSDNREDFDSHLVDDACLITRQGKYWFYYKGRQLGKGPGQTKMGVAIADKPEGPYVKHESNPVIPGNHEVLVWPQGDGVAAMIGTTGPKEITKSVLYSEDGIKFSKTHSVVKGPWAGGAYRPEAFTQSGKGQVPEWGVEISRARGKKKGKLPCIGRFDVATDSPDAASQTFSDDLEFMKQHTKIVLLQEGDAAVAVAPAYQGRVMTSTFDSKAGPSFGWINRPVIEKGLLSDEEKKGKLEEHIYIFGGEERFWLGPEGGQYAVFFKPGAKFEFSDWATPPAIDTEAFEVVTQTETSASFKHKTELINHSGTKFDVGIDRTVKLLNQTDAAQLLNVELGKGLRIVGYETDNRITNTGAEAWKADTGLLSIWILGMYNPSPTTTVVIPFKEGKEDVLGPVVNDSYFGKVPVEYLKVEKQKLFFKGDGTRRGKIGISAQRSKGIAGSYDAAGQVLNIVTYNVQEAPQGFVNSMWELQKKPYAGDVINSYNDGSPEEGKPPLGPFYELETSSPAAALQPGKTMRHVQRTFHIQGSEKALNPLAKQLLGVELDAIKTAFTNPAPSGSDDNAATTPGGTTHRFLACGKQTYIMETNGKKSWTYPASTRDGYVLDDGRIVLALSKSKKHRGGAAIVVDPKSGEEEILWKGTQAEVNSVQPTDTGTFVLTEAGSNPRLIEIDRTGKILVEFGLKCQKKNQHMQTRMARKLSDGTYLAPHLLDFAVFHYDAKGNVLSKYDTTVKDDPEHKIHSWPFTAIRHGDGHTLACLTHSKRVVDFDAEGKIVWQLTNEDLPGDWLQDPCGGQVLPNGNIVITSYAAGRHDPTAPKLIEVNRDKQVVWKYADGKNVGIHHFQILDTNGERITGPQK